MCLGGKSRSKLVHATKSAEELAKETDNPYKNPESGEETPSWKKEELKAKKTEKKTTENKTTQQSEKYG